MPKPPPDILQFDDYREYLKAQYRYLKLNDRKFSHRYVNQKLGVKSTGWFGDVVAGRQGLKPAQVKAIATVFKMGPKDQKCLRALVEMSAAKAPEEVAAAYEKWYEAKGIGMETVAKDRFKFYDHWYFSALREMLAMDPKQRDPHILAARLDPPITPAQARKALDVLVKLGFLGQAEPTSARLSLPALVKDPAIRSMHWKRMIRAMIRLGQRALEKYDKEQRDISGLTLSLSPEGLKAAGEEVAALRKRLLYMSEKDKHSNRVFNCVFQIYPVSVPLEASRV